MSAKAFAIRPARAEDIPAICAIYRREVLERAATFELTPPDEAEMTARMRGTLDGGFPYLAAEAEGRLRVTLTRRRFGVGRRIGLRWRIPFTSRRRFSGGGLGWRC